MEKIQIFYKTIFLLSMLMTMIYVKLWHKHFSVNLSLSFAFIPITNLGYMLQAQVAGLEAYIITQQVTYIGGCFIMLFTMLNIFDVCKVSPPKWLRALLMLMSMVTYCSVLTIGKSDIFYKSIALQTTDGIPEVTKEYGFMHTLHHIVIGIDFLLSFAVILYSLKKKKEFSQKMAWLLFLPESVAFFSFFGGRLLTRKFDILPAGYLFAQIIYLIIAHKMCLYDVIETAVDSLTESGSTGFVSFDNNLHYLGSNQTAKAIFPETKDFCVDKAIPENSENSRLILSWIENFKANHEENKFYFHQNDRIYLVDMTYLYDETRKCGYQLVITDDTANQQNMELITNYNTLLKQEVSQKTEDIVKMHNNLIKGTSKNYAKISSI